MQRAQSAPPSAVAHAAGVENMHGLAQHTPCLCRLACLCDAAETACPPAQNSVDHRLVFLGVAILGIVLVVQLLQHIPEMCCDAALEVCIVQRPA